MATIITYDRDRLQEVVDGTVTTGTVNGNGELMLTKRDNTVLNGGVVKGPVGFQGPGKPPPGAQILLYAGNTPPVGWLFCDGSAVSRVNFSELFAIIGTTYGSGDGTTTFTLPDFRGRIPVGVDATQTEFNALNARGGTKTETLTTAQIPSHSHNITIKAGVDNKDFDGFSGGFAASDATSPYDQVTQTTGSGTAHNNLQPYLTMNYIIATAATANGLALHQGGGISAPRYYTSTDRGTTAERDAKYGVPATSAERVALANKKVSWYNTTLGWKERYYAGSTESGLQGVGISVGSAGWYPLGDGPYIELEALAEVNNFIGTFITGWSIYNRKGGSSWFTLNGTDRVDVLKHGRYDIKAFTNQYGGNTAAPDYSLQVLDTDNSTIVRVVGGGAFTKNIGLMTRPHQEAYDQAILPNQKVAWKLQRGTIPGTDTNMPVHTGDGTVVRGRMAIKYMGPILAEIES